MPIYEYRCKNCGNELEIIQKISDPPLVECPKCGKESLEKVISPTQFQLKGTGWYVTDFKDNAKKKEQPKATETSTTPAAEKKSSSES